MRPNLLMIVVLCTPIGLPVVALAQDSKITRQAESTRMDQFVDDLLHRVPGLDLGLDLKLGRIFGDHVAMAITKKIRMKDLDDADTAERVLKLLEYAFFEPDQISEAGDSQPAVSLFLADYLAEHCTVAALRLRASDLVTRLVALDSKFRAVKVGK